MSVPFTPVPNAPDRGQIAVVRAVHEVVVRNGVTDGEAGELDEGAQDTRRSSGYGRSGRRKVTRRLLGDDRRVGADRAVVGLGPEVHGQVHAGAERIDVIAVRVSCADRRGHVITTGVGHAIDVVSPQVASDLQAGVGAGM